MKPPVALFCTAVNWPQVLLSCVEVGWADPSIQGSVFWLLLSCAEPRHYVCISCFLLLLSCAVRLRRLPGLIDQSKSYLKFADNFNFQLVVGFFLWRN